MQRIVACAFVFALVLLLPMSANAQTTPRRVFIAGDSTASAYGPERAPRSGWGEALPSFLDATNWEVRNHARSGRSSRSFIEQGFLDPIAAELRKGDVLLIQFGHNDARIDARAKRTAARVPEWLSRDWRWRATRRSRS